jgi:hypothetical protein
MCAGSNCGTAGEDEVDVREEGEGALLEGKAETEGEEGPETKGYEEAGVEVGVEGAEETWRYRHLSP